MPMEAITLIFCRIILGYSKWNSHTLWKDIILLFVTLIVTIELFCNLNPNLWKWLPYLSRNRIIGPFKFKCIHPQELNLSHWKMDEIELQLGYQHTTIWNFNYCVWKLHTYVMWSEKTHHMMQNWYFELLISCVSLNYSLSRTFY